MEVIMTIGLAPVTKKNSQQILKNTGTGRPFIVPSRAYREYAEAAAWCLRTYRLETIRQPVEVKALFFMPTRRRVDLTNLLEALDDVLEETADEHDTRSLEYLQQCLVELVEAKNNGYIKMADIEKALRGEYKLVNSAE